MPNADHRDGYFYPTLTLMIDSYSNMISGSKKSYEPLNAISNSEVCATSKGLRSACAYTHSEPFQVA